MKVRDKLLIALLLCALLLLGFYRYMYAINFFNPELDSLIPHNHYLHASFDLKQLINGSDPRLYSMLFYAVVSFSCTLILVSIYFKDKISNYIVIVFYGILYIAVVCCFGGVSWMLEFKQGVLSAQKVKNFLNSPFPLVILFPLLYWRKQRNK